MGWARKRRVPKAKKWDTPERQKNGRNQRRRILLSKADTDKTWRYGLKTERIDI